MSGAEPGIGRRLATASRRIPSPAHTTKGPPGLLNRTPARIEGDCAFGLSDYAHAIVRGGFPGTQQLSDRASRLSLSGYTQLIVQRDVPEAGLGVRDPPRCSPARERSRPRLARRPRGRACATPPPQARATSPRGRPHDHGPMRWSASGSPTLWSKASRAQPPPQVGSTAQHHLADPALACALLGLDEDDLLTGVHPEPTVPRDGVFLGALFESWPPRPSTASPNPLRRASDTCGGATATTRSTS
jgi:hypothetical protein